MAEMRVTYFERDETSGSLEEVTREQFSSKTSKRAARAALEAAERWIEPSRRNRTYRIDRLLPPD
jgi:hypothetical protein